MVAAVFSELQQAWRVEWRGATDSDRLVDWTWQTGLNPRVDLWRRNGIESIESLNRLIDLAPTNCILMLWEDVFFFFQLKKLKLIQPLVPFRTASWHRLKNPQDGEKPSGPMSNADFRKFLMSWKSPVRWQKNGSGSGVRFFFFWKSWEERTGKNWVPIAPKIFIPGCW